MLFKLALGNIRKSAGDYAVYFTTVALTAAMLFAFYSVAYSKTIQEFSQGGERVVMINLVSVAVVLACGWLIDFTTRFLLHKRAKELAVYYTLGLLRGRASLLFLTEHFLVGAASLVTGMIGGTLLFQALSAVLANVFKASYRLRLELNGTALLLTGLCFLAIELFVLLRSRRVLWRMRIPELLRLEQKSGAAHSGNPYVWLGVFTVSMFLCAGCLIGVREGLAQMNMKTEEGMWSWILFGTLSGMAGLAGLYAGLTRLLPFLLPGGERWLLRDANLFFRRQLLSGRNGGGLLTGSVALLSALAMTAFSGGSFFAATMLENAEAIYSFDLMITLDAPDVDFSPQLAEIEDRLTIKEQLDYLVYTTENTQVRGIFGEFAEKGVSYFQDGPQVIALGDYNRMLGQAGEKPLSLSLEEYAMGTNNRYQERKLGENLAGKPTLTLGGRELHPAAAGKNGVLRRTQGPWRCFLILPDEVIRMAKEELSILRRGLIVSTTEGIPAEMASLFKDSPVFSIVSDGETVYAPLADGERVDRDGRLVYKTEQGELLITYAGSGYQNSAGEPVKAFPVSLLREEGMETERSMAMTLSFALFYLGVVFSMIGAAILSVQQLSDSAKFRGRFTLLRRLGLSERKLGGMLLRQLSCCFFLPLAAPIGMTAMLMALFNQGFERYLYSDTLWLSSLLTTVGLFLSVYVCYFWVTYFQFQRNIFER